MHPQGELTKNSKIFFKLRASSSNTKLKIYNFSVFLVISKQSLIITAFFLALFLNICYVFVQRKTKPKPTEKNLSSLLEVSMSLFAPTAIEIMRDLLLLYWSRCHQSFIMFPFLAKFKGISLNRSHSGWKTLPDTRSKTHVICFALNKFYLYFLSVY